MNSFFSSAAQKSSNEFFYHLLEPSHSSNSSTQDNVVRRSLVSLTDVSKTCHCTLKKLLRRSLKPRRLLTSQVLKPRKALRTLLQQMWKNQVPLCTSRTWISPRHKPA